MKIMAVNGSPGKTWNTATLPFWRAWQDSNLRPTD
jgi:hypothetical protein